MYTDKVFICERYLITPITGSRIPECFFQKNQYLIRFTADYMISKFDTFIKNKLHTLYLTKI